jgi:hypothetical protein
MYREENVNNTDVLLREAIAGNDENVETVFDDAGWKAMKKYVPKYAYSMEVQVICHGLLATHELNQMSYLYYPLPSTYDTA